MERLLKTLIFYICCICVVRTDTPANCTYEDARGSWTFSLGTKADKDACDFGSGGNLMIMLRYPDVAVDQYGNKGFWTLIYNQGFEVVIGGRKYFGFFKYEKDGPDVRSFCDQLSPGWSHDVLGRLWKCFQAKKNTKIAPRVYTERTLSRPNEKPRMNMNFINAINAQQSSWRATHYPELLTMTHQQQFLRRGGPKSRILNRPHPAPVSRELKRLADALPSEFDWRNVSGQSFVSPVRNQGSCGSCYSFSSMGMLEARLLILRKNQIKVQFSEQDIVDCSPYAQGCDGGFPYLIAGKHAEDFGVVTEQCNPYWGRQFSKCTTNTSSPKCRSRMYATGYRYVGGYYGACNEALMRLALVNNGPLSVSFEVYSDFQAYKSGIYHHTGLSDGYNPFQLTNHAVLLVGYGKEAKTGESFWIVKNSWGTGWGENGYFRIRRNTDECAIESMAVESFPIL